MPVKVPDNLPAIYDLRAEQVDVMASRDALRQDIRPIRLLLLNLMPNKRQTEIQFARLFGNSPLQVDLVLMTTKSYAPRNTDPAYIRRYYRSLDDVRGDRFDALVITGAPVETMPFDEVDYWPELVEIMDWSRTNCYRRLGVCWGAQALLSHFHDVPKHTCPSKRFGVFEHRMTRGAARLLCGFTETFPMPVSRHTETRRRDLDVAGLDTLADNDVCGVGLVRNPGNGDLYVMNHLEYDAETLNAEYLRDMESSPGIAPPKGYFPGDDPKNLPVNFWRPYAFLLVSNWLNDLYQATPFDLSATDDLSMWDDVNA